MSLLHQLILWNCTADLRFPSPSVCLHSHVCWSMNMCEWASCSISSPSFAGILQLRLSRPERRQRHTPHPQNQAAHTPPTLTSPRCRYSGIANLLGLIWAASPSPVLFTFIRSPNHRWGKGRQAVASSRQRVRWLGGWSSAVPLEDDPVDENRGDGPGGAAGETENRHPKHRWVTTC